MSDHYCFMALLMDCRKYREKLESYLKYLETFWSVGESGRFPYVAGSSSDEVRRRAGSDATMVDNVIYWPHPGLHRLQCFAENTVQNTEEVSKGEERVVAGQQQRMLRRQRVEKHSLQWWPTSTRYTEEGEESYASKQYELSVVLKEWVWGSARAAVGKHNELIYARFLFFSILT